MATTNVSVTNEWTSIKAGAAAVNLQNRGSVDIYYAVAGSAPSSTSVDGGYLRPDSIHPITVAGGENLYVRTPSGTAKATLIDA